MESINKKRWWINIRWSGVINKFVAEVDNTSSVGGDDGAVLSKTSGISMTPIL